MSLRWAPMEFVRLCSAGTVPVSELIVREYWEQTMASPG